MKSLVARCLEGDEAAWKELVDLHRPFMLDFARRISGDNAADVVDEALANLWQRRRLATYEGRSSLRTWLVAIVVHAALNAKRATVREVSASVESRDRTSSDAPGGREEELAAAILVAIRELPEETRLMVQLHYEQGLTLDRIASMLGVSKSTISRDLKEARATIYGRADRAARQRFGRSLAELRDDASLDRLDLDLRAACAGPLQRNEP